MPARSAASRPENGGSARSAEGRNRLSAPVGALYGVGPALKDKLSQLGISTVGDLLYHFPRRYLDRSTVNSIGGARVGQDTTVIGTVRSIESRRTRARRNILVVTIFDGTGYISGVWFNQEYHKERLKEGVEVAFSGQVRFEYNRLQMVNPDYDVLGGKGSGSKSEGLHTGRIIPIYPATAGLTSAALRRTVSRALEVAKDMPDPVPESIRHEFDLVPLYESLREVHFPTDADSLKKARFRAVFDEVFYMQVGLALKKKRRERDMSGISHRAPGDLVRRFVDSLPFELTTAQRRAWLEIEADMRKETPMNRLLQGEVGSGKTVVAVMALLLAVESGFQGAIMAPTEVLAHQHYRRIGEMLSDTPVRVEILAGGTAAGQVKDVMAGKVDVAIGTHALIQDAVTFKNLGIAVIDEQHRFGVGQRSDLAAKGTHPDVLHMSATPIPRTLSLTLYGDLDSSVIDEMPPGRKGVVTVVAGRDQRDGAYAMVEREVEQGRQAFVICPLVEESDRLEARAAEEEADRLAKVFPGYTIGLLHGQMKGDEKRAVMERFQSGEIDILISTLVVEVGVDVPNATAMIIENADRFGLAQLHQLRGRIGRGNVRAICVMFADPTTEEGRARMEAIRKYDDGFALAEADLAIRGEGTLFGTRQSGLPDLKLARLTRDFELISRARETAFHRVEEDPELAARESALLRREVQRRFSGALEWLFHG